LAAFQNVHDATCEEIAFRLGWKGYRGVVRVRKRVTELIADELIEDTGARRKNDEGESVRVLRVAGQSKQQELF